MGATMNLGCPSFFQWAQALSIRDSPLKYPFGFGLGRRSKWAVSPSGSPRGSEHRRSSSSSPWLTAPLLFDDEVEVRVWMAIKLYDELGGCGRRRQSVAESGFLITLIRWRWRLGRIRSPWPSFEFGGENV